MRNIFLPFLLATPLLLAAQDTRNTGCDRHAKSRIPATSKPHAVARPASRDALDPLWTEDFENGLNGWTVATTTGPVNWQLTSTGNTNGYTPGPLQSTTGFPGGHWIDADSDEQGTAGVQENTSITSPPILGFDTISYMVLRFEQSFRQLNNDQTLVEVSGNGGLGWTTYPVNQDIAGNLSTPGAPLAQTIVINISNAIAGGSSDIRVRFHWISDQGYTYSWQVDDVALLPVHPNDLVLQNATYAAWDLTAPDYSGMPCTIYPVHETRPLKFRGMVGNNGSMVQTNVRLRVDVDGPDANDATLLSDPITLAPASTDSLFITSYTPPAIVGDYVFHISVQQDQTDEAPEDNSLDEHIRVDPSIFARDEDHLMSERDDGGLDYELGNRFYVQDYNETLYAVDVALGPSTEPGALMSASVYDGGMNLIGESIEYTVQASDINDYGDSVFVRLPLIDPVLLNGEWDYLACVHATGGSLWAGISGVSIAQTSLIHKFSPDHWYYVTTTPMVRMDFSAIAGVSEHNAAPFGITASPSVFSTSTTITFGMKNTGSASWELRDMSGRMVRGEELGTLPSGDQHILIDGGDLAGGVYVLTVSNGAMRSSLRLVHTAGR